MTTFPQLISDTGTIFDTDFFTGPSAMPFIQVRALPFETDLDIPGLCAELSLEFSQQTRIPLKHISLVWQNLEPGHYAVAGEISDHQLKGSHPIIVEVLIPDFHDQASQAKMLTALRASIAKHTHVDVKNVFAYCRLAASQSVYEQGEIQSW